jgi:hypothetical protein
VSGDDTGHTQTAVDLRNPLPPTGKGGGSPSYAWVVSTRRLVRFANALGWVVVVMLIALPATGIFLKRFYTPTAAQAYADIQSLHTSIAWGLLIRNVHRWVSWLMVPGVLSFGVAYTLAGTRSGITWRTNRWMLKLTAAGLVLGAALVESVTGHPELRRWYFEHQLPGYLLIAVMGFAVAVRPRAPKGAA